jgi:CHAD domain-containing protein
MTSARVTWRLPAGAPTAGALAELRRAGFTAGQAFEEQLVVLDTAGRALLGAGRALVVVDGRCALYDVAALVGRARWPHAAGGPAAALARGKVRQALLAWVGDAPLAPVVALQRRAVPLANADDTARAELEVLRTTLPAAPDPLVIDVRGAKPAAAGRAKGPAIVAALRALQLVGGGRGPVALDPAADACDAVRRVLVPLVERLRSFEAGVRAGDVEGLHDWRVALRSLRALLSLLGDALPRRPVERLRRHLRWLQQETGPLRDLDVLHASLGPQEAQVLAWIDARRVEERARVTAVLDSRRYTKLHARLAALGAGEGRGEHGWTPIVLLVRLRAHEAWRELVGDGRAITDASPAEALHDLRKVGKRLRYLVELTGGVLPEKPARTLVKRLKGLQDVLGRLQDEEVQQGLLQGVEGAQPLLDALTAAHVATRAAFQAAFREVDTDVVDLLGRDLWGSGARGTA